MVNDNKDNKNSSQTMVEEKSLNQKLYSDDNLDVTTFKCKNCGGEAVFDPTTQKMHCLYCGSYFDIDDKTIVIERDLDDLLNNGNLWESAEVYQCKSCGAKEILDKNEISMKCPFCGTSNIVKTEELPGLKPQGINPFKINRQQAVNIATIWAKKKLYAPRDFKRSLKLDKIHGIYNPVFTFDAKTENSYNGVLGKYVTRYRYVNGKQQSYTETRYFNIRGSQDVNFDDLLVQASTTIPENVIKLIEPFPTKQAIDYKTDYLRGYFATSYNRTGKECWNECKQIMNNVIERQILKNYNYDIKLRLEINTIFSKEQYKYVLVPIYVGHYKYRKKLYNFYINGDSGKIAGKTPVSALKVSLTIILSLLIVTGIILLIMYF